MFLEKLFKKKLSQLAIPLQCTCNYITIEIPYVIYLGGSDGLVTRLRIPAMERNPQKDRSRKDLCVSAKQANAEY